MYCKNCYRIQFSPTFITKMAGVRGGTLAVDADKNCNFKGSAVVRLSKFTMDDAVSVHDGGALLYSRTDCFIDMSLADARISNIRSNLVANGTMT